MWVLNVLGRKKMSHGKSLCELIEYTKKMQEKKVMLSSRKLLERLMTVRITPRFEEHLWYPILVKGSSGGTHIVEMQGREVNRWNDMVQQQYEQEMRNQPRGWRI